MLNLNLKGLGRHAHVRVGVPHILEQRRHGCCPIKRRSRRERSRMAKKKRSAALFEVMVKQEQRRLPRPPGVFKTLYLWFKNRPGPQRPAAVAAMAAMPEQDLAQEAVITAPFVAPPLR